MRRPSHKVPDLRKTRRRTGPAAGHSRKALCTSCTQIDPSPTAEATRFTLPARTSPTAKMPGWLVSRRWGARCSGHSALCEVLRGQVAAGLDEALLVERQAFRRASAVFGIAPVIEKTWRIGRARLLAGGGAAPGALLEVRLALERRRSPSACAA